LNTKKARNDRRVRGSSLADAFKKLENTGSKMMDGASSVLSQLLSTNGATPRTGDGETKPEAGGTADDRQKV